MNSKLFEQILKEATYNWDLDPDDRAWFISQDGKVLADVGHYLIVKREFKDEWNQLQAKGFNEDNCERVLTNRLIKMGWVKIGELKDFYVIVSKLENREKDIIQGFVKSWAKVADIKNRKIRIESSNDTVNCMMEDIVNDYLYGE
jgi:hypothetical protein